MRLSVKDTAPSTIEAFGPFCSYHFSRGLVLTISPEHASLKGGPALEKVYSLNKTNAISLNSPPNYSQLIDTIEREIGIRLIAASPLLCLRDLSHSTFHIQTTFRIDDCYIDAGYLAEALLTKFQTLESHCQRLVLQQIKKDSLSEALEAVAVTKDHVRDGRLGPNELDKQIQGIKSKGLPIEEAFFLSNGKSLADGARSTILRACYHFAKMTQHIYEINQQGIDSYYPGKEKQAPCEIVHSAEITDQISNEFASTIAACYSSLDLLYEWFVYLTRQPFGKPHLPKGLHFPDQSPEKALVEGGTVYLYDLQPQAAPYAIPNLQPKTFLGLRRMRNDLVHNMAPDELRSRVCIGIGFPPVNGELLQYCQYISRDTDALGNPTDHTWMRHFYKDQTDAQHFLHDWLTKTWQSFFDTTEWLTNRLLNM